MSSITTNFTYNNASSQQVDIGNTFVNINNSNKSWYAGNTSYTFGQVNSGTSQPFTFTVTVNNGVTLSGGILNCSSILFVANFVSVSVSSTTATVTANIQTTANAGWSGATTIFYILF